MRKVLKFFLHYILCQLLLFVKADLVLRSFSRNKRLIVMYHGVRKNHGRINGRHITARQFEQQLRYFSKHYEVVSLQEICSMKHSGIVPGRPTIALTFDDGFLNNITVALPLLMKYKMPATFFVCSAGIEEKEYFHPTDLIDLVRSASRQTEIKIGTKLFTRKDHQLIDDDGKHAYQYINSSSLPHWKETLAMLKEQCTETNAFRKIDPELYTLMDKHILHSIPASISIGSHSHHHHNLLALTPDELRHQLKHSKQVLEQYSTVASFAFPYGYFDQTVIQEAKKAGYSYLIAGGDVAPEYSHDVFPRIGVLDGAGFAYSMLSLSKGFNRFGF